MGRVVDAGAPAKLPSEGGLLPAAPLYVPPPPPPPGVLPTTTKVVPPRRGQVRGKHYTPPPPPAYHRRGRQPERLLGVTDVARELGISPEAVIDHRRRDPKWLPRANYLGPPGGGNSNGRPRELWRRAKLVKAGVLKEREV